MDKSRRGPRTPAQAETDDRRGHVQACLAESLQPGQQARNVRICDLENPNPQVRAGGQQEGNILAANPPAFAHLAHGQEEKKGSESYVREKKCITIVEQVLKARRI